MAPSTLESLVPFLTGPVSGSALEAIGSVHLSKHRGSELSIAVSDRESYLVRDICPIRSPDIPSNVSAKSN